MFQDFSAPPEGAGNPQRIAKLREVMRAAGFDGFLVPRADEHQGEYVPPHAERLAFATGFTGSAGIAVILHDRAAIFVDGRYTLQVRDQVATSVIEPINSADQTIVAWLEKTLKPGMRLAYDPWLHTVNDVAKLSKASEKAGANLVASDNLVDRIWQDQPALPAALVSLQPLEYAGQAAFEKITALQGEILRLKAAAFLLTQPDSICWLLNIRGADVPHTPLVLAFMIVPASGKAELFLDPAKCPPDIRDALTPYVTLRPRDALLQSLEAISGPIALDPSNASAVFKTHIEAAGGALIEAQDPCILPKARKNAAEREGSRRAHRRDGAAICRFLAWLSRRPAEALDEIQAARQLETFRRMMGEADGVRLCDLSFDTISGFGPNGAIVHYRVTEATNRRFENGTLYLIDSGGQYQDGTTDITRTVAIGTPDAAMKRHFTLVLKGMIAIARLRFPEGTSGAQIDAFARHALWQHGLDFDHGTGHGVGSFLGVHEGPQRISKISTVPLEPGMIVSNEPGFYKTAAYGIRIENLLIVTEPAEIAGGERPMMGFETLTFAPIDRTLIEPDFLDAGERSWLDFYHCEVRQRIAPLLEGQDRLWLEAATRPL
ncbi:MAG: aminopeptidase P family protein [Rhizobiales bacterium]|nr:aminopeptidase P family protein [Hyphomicrobiales bacterium]